VTVLVVTDRILADELEPPSKLGSSGTGCAATTGEGKGVVGAGVVLDIEITDVAVALQNNTPPPKPNVIETMTTINM